MAIEKIVLSGVADGIPLSLANTSTPGDTVHTAHNTAKDEIWLWADNIHTADVEVTVEHGDATANLNSKVTVPKNEGSYLIVPGLILTNSKVLNIFAGTTAVINVRGYVNRIT